MSKKSRTLRAAPISSADRAGAVTKLSGPGDAIAMIPYLLGFTPHESLVVIALEGPRRRFGPCIRMDLVTETADVPAQVEFVEALVRQHSFEQVMVFAFSAQGESAATVLRSVQHCLGAAGVDVLDAVRADGARWWSMSCVDAACCNPGGTAYDSDSSRVAAEAVLAGLQRAPDRESLRASVAPLPSGLRRAEVAAAVDAAVEAIDPFGPKPADPTALIRAGLAAPSALTVAEVAELAVAVQHLPTRDAAWAMMSRANAGDHFELWRTVMQSVPDQLLAPVGSLTAFAAWLSGSGVLASHACERVLTADPEYSMARLVAEALTGCLHPDTWQPILPPVPGGG